MVKEKKYSWHKIAGSINELHLATNGLASVEVNGKMVCISKYKNTIAACTHKCPHAGAIMADGFVDGLGNVVCPLHGYKFNPTNGRNITGEGYFLKTFPTNITEEGVFIGFEENNS